MNHAKWPGKQNKLLKQENNNKIQKISIGFVPMSNKKNVNKNRNSAGQNVRFRLQQ